MVIRKTSLQSEKLEVLSGTSCAYGLKRIGASLEREDRRLRCHVDAQTGGAPPLTLVVRLIGHGIRRSAAATVGALPARRALQTSPRQAREKAFLSTDCRTDTSNGELSGEFAAHGRAGCDEPDVVL